jgi:nucleoside-diphosphate-sugar epimerase
MRMRRILITGAGGFVGRRLAAVLAARGDDVVALHRATEPPAPVRGEAPINWIRRDISDELTNVPAVDAIVHAAALHPNSRSGSSLTDYVNVNVIGTERVMNYAKSAGARFVLNLSTISVYGDLPSGLVTEDSPLFRPKIYGASKYLAELVVAEYAEGISSVSVRLPGVVGPGHFIPWIGRVLRKALAGEPISIFNPGAKFNNIVDLIEMERLVTHLVDAMPRGALTVNFGATEPSTIGEVVANLVRLASSRSEVRVGTSSRGSFYISTERLEHKLNFRPAPTMSIVERYVTSSLRGER